MRLIDGDFPDYTKVIIQGNPKLAKIDRAHLVSPVRFPPGFAKLSTNPVAAGSKLVTMTKGIVLVASLAPESLI